MSRMTISLSLISCYRDVRMDYYEGESTERLHVEVNIWISEALHQYLRNEYRSESCIAGPDVLPRKKIWRENFGCCILH